MFQWFSLGLCRGSESHAAKRTPWWAREGFDVGQGSRRESKDTAVPMCSTAETSPPRRQMKCRLFSTVTVGAAMAYPGVLMTSPSNVQGRGCGSTTTAPNRGREWVCPCLESSSGSLPGVLGEQQC